MGCSRFWCLLAFRQAAYFWQYLKAKMVPTERFELSTSPLPRECSTPELCGRRERRDIATGAGPNSSFAGAALTAGRASREHGPWPPRASPHPPPHRAARPRPRHFATTCAGASSSKRLGASRKRRPIPLHSAGRRPARRLSPNRS